MRTARKLTLLAMLAIAATAVAAPFALANEPLEHELAPHLIVQQEIHAANDVNCPLVTPSPAPNPGPLVTGGGCRVHITSSLNHVMLYLHNTLGVEVHDSTCRFEADMRIDNSGEGYLAHQELTGAECTAEACGQASPPSDEGRAWTFYMHELEPVPRERMVLLLCVEDLGGGTPLHCEFDIPMSQLSTHRYRVSANDLRQHNPSEVPCEFTGALDFETAAGNTGEAQTRQNVEIRHP